MQLSFFGSFLVAVLTATCGLTSQAQEPSGGEKRAVHFGDAGGTELLMDIVAPSRQASGPTPAFVMLHGGGWAGGARADMLSRAHLLADHGYVAATVEYRLAGKSPFPAQLEDCKCAVRFLRANAAKYGLDPSRIGVWGCSAGGHLASMLGLTDQMPEFEGEGGSAGVSSAVQLVVDCFGPSDFSTWEEVCNKLARDPQAQHLFGPSGPDKNLKWQENFSLKADPNLAAFFDGKSDERAKWASPITYAGRKGVVVPPFLIVQGTQDAWVPMQQSILLADALDANGAKVTLLLEPNMGHDDTKAFPKILAYIESQFPLVH